MYLGHILTWHIDDILIIWEGSPSLLQEFLDKLNKNDYNLNFTHSFDNEKIPFLDVMISIDENGLISTDLYRKPTVGNSLLRANSAPPHSLKRSIPFAQYIRLRRICSKDSDFILQAGSLQKDF